MKTRTCFVSNSSTSSYICDVCGREEMGFDLDLEQADMLTCLNNHTFCEKEAVNLGDSRINDFADRYEVSPTYCPICNFQELCERDVAIYLEQKTKIPRDEAFAEVKKSNKRRKKLYNYEYVMYVCLKSGIDRKTLLPKLKEQFNGDYTAFRKTLR